jgi:hypothetical protein
MSGEYSTRARFPEPHQRKSPPNVTLAVLARHERRLPPFLSSAGIARDFIAACLRQWGLDDCIDDAKVIIGEMFNNALLHAPSEEFVVAIDWNGGAVRLEMLDSSPARPTVLPEDPFSEHGRGMRLIVSLSRMWGTRLTASGKCVWAILRDCEV